VARREKNRVENITTTDENRNLEEDKLALLRMNHEERSSLFGRRFSFLFCLKYREENSQLRFDRLSETEARRDDGLLTFQESIAFFIASL
jgi:hypothetical protein